MGDDGSVTIQNVAARMHARDVVLDVPGYGRVEGDVAWGGNWFFITHSEFVPVDMAHLGELTTFTQAVQDALRAAGITGADNGDIDHIEISAPPAREDADCRNFVLCSGGEYDRSPCGTGTAAKMATLHARGELAFDEQWAQEGIVGGMFTGWLSEGTDGSLVNFDARDPFRFGIPQTALVSA